MTEIKPPSGPTTTLPHSLGELQGAPDSVLGTGDPLPGVSHQPSSDAVSQAESGNRVDLVQLARAVELGQLSMAQAVDRLVEGTVGSLPGQLTDLERAELSALLRQAVQTDPTLSALRNE